MQIFLAIDDEKTGPFTLFQVEERLRSGELEETDLGWYDGLEKWKPLKDLAPFEGFFRRREMELEDERKRKAAARAAAFEKEQAAALPKAEVRPWTRFFARNLDWSFFVTFCVAILSGMRALGWTDLSYTELMQLLPIIIPAWHIMEAYFISQWGTTPGKGLVGITITDAERNRLSFGPSMRRSLGVFVLGMGCYVSFLFMIALPFGYYLLQKHKRSFWDVSAGTYVHHAPLQAKHFLWPLIILFLLSFVFQDAFSEIADYNSAELEKIRELFRGGQSNTL